MKWATFKTMDIGQVVDTIQSWEKGEDNKGAEEFAVDVIDNVLFRFEAGSMLETVTDAALSIGGPTALAKVGARIATLLSAGLHAKPFASLPF